MDPLVGVIGILVQKAEQGEPTAALTRCPNRTNPSYEIYCREHTNGP